MATAISGRILESPLLSDRFRPFPHVTWVRQAETTVLLDAERGMYYTLNEVGGRIWELLVAGEPAVEILECLGEEFEVSEEALQADTFGLLGRLLAARLIERTGHEGT